MYAVSRVSKNSLPSKEWKSLMKRMKGKARAFRIFIPIPLQTGKEEKLLPTSRTQDTAFLIDYFVDASRYSSSRLDLAYTTRNEISLKFGSYKILAPFLPHCPFPPPPSPPLPISPSPPTPALHCSCLPFPSLLLTSLLLCLVTPNRRRLDEEKRLGIVHMWPSERFMENGRFPSRTLYQPSPRLGDSNRRMSPTHS